MENVWKSNILKVHFKGVRNCDIPIFLLAGTVDQKAKHLKLLTPHWVFFIKYVFQEALTMYCKCNAETMIPGALNSKYTK